MVLNGFGKTLLSLTFVSALGLPAVEATAASQCKGLEESACNGNPSCTWISAYTTKSGKSISAYCRSASGKAGKSVMEGEKGPVTEQSGRAGSAAGKPDSVGERRG
jgi:hypothetical protein